MASRSMALDVLVRLKDMLSSPLRGLRRSLQGVADMAKKIGIVGTAIAAISFMAPMKEAAAFQQQLLDIAGTAGKSGSAAYRMIDELKARYEGLALQVGQTSDTIAKGSGKMIAAGLDEALVDRSLKGIGKATKAANADFDDMAGVAISLLQTLKLPASELDDTFAGLIVAGKEGSFELKDMAKYFPTLTGQMAKLGITGRTAATQLATMLEIARKGTADPAEAANNLNNFLSKITAPETRKNFQKMGVDIQGVMLDAATKGINPIEAVIQKVSKLTGISGKEIEGLMKKAKASGLTGADALEEVRKQLEAIHGAGALGGLFSDMQVMGFLIPMLGNIDEYKRIKQSVSEATGAMSDADFATQMQSLNTQLITFGELGTQAWREVGLAFGTWMPSINAYLQDGLKWLRETDAATGGLVKTSLAWAGAGILVAAGLGALGIILPILGAGLAAVGALISPFGLALAGVAAGAMYIYRNWNTYGPRLTQLWQRTKTGFFRFADDMKERGGRIVEAGREMVNRYGPIIRAGFASAWQDIKAGWNNLQPLFEGFRKGLDFKIDLSGLTIDDAKLAAFRSLDASLKGIAQGWQSLKDFGTGFSPYLKGMGEDLGGAVKATGEFAGNLVRLVDALGKLGSSSEKKNVTVINVDKLVGDLVGGSLGLIVKGLREIAEAFAGVTGDLAKLAETVNNGIPWEKLLPQSIVDTWNGLASAVERVKAAMNFGGSMQPGSIAPNGGTVASADDHAANDDWLNPLPGIPANNNRPAIAAAQRPVNQQVQVGGTVNIKVDGPGTVTGTSTDNSAVPITANTGRAVGRP
jgi:hypothetical protein